MQDVSNLRQVLVQTQAVQRTQENARRRGEIQQQATARHLVDKVDIQGRHVEGSQKAADPRVDPDAGRGQGQPPGEDRQPRREKQPPGGREPTIQEDEEPAVDVRVAGPAEAPDQDGKGTRVDLTEDGPSDRRPAGSPEDEDGKGSVIDVKA